MVSESYRKLHKLSFSMPDRDPKRMCWSGQIGFHHLAALAYAALPDDFVEQQCIMRFCQGCRDKESGQWAMNMRPSTLEKAVNLVQWNRHTFLFGSGKK